MIKEQNHSIIDWELYHKIKGTPTIWETEYKFRKKRKQMGIIKRLLWRWRKYLSYFKVKLSGYHFSKGVKRTTHRRQSLPTLFLKTSVKPRRAICN